MCNPLELYASRRLGKTRSTRRLCGRGDKKPLAAHQGSVERASPPAQPARPAVFRYVAAFEAPDEPGYLPPTLPSPRAAHCVLRLKTSPTLNLFSTVIQLLLTNSKQLLTVSRKKVSLDGKKILVSDTKYIIIRTDYFHSLSYVIFSFESVIANM